ncbi:MAG: hypothetical protein MJ178_09935 [Treponemataceae bacterium]|nr:hypothetical protein [Treponemataceae bacterium]
MERTFITTMPDQFGAFLKACNCLSSLGLNITRVNYNKAVDLHTLFITAEGHAELLDEAEERLKEIGYIQENPKESQIYLVVFTLQDVPGTVAKVLELIQKYRFNISYINSQQDYSGYQQFKMGIFADDPNAMASFMTEVRQLCPAELLPYNTSEKYFDNSIFYTSYIKGLGQMLSIDEKEQKDLMVYTNCAMQTLDDQNKTPFQTFDAIYGFARIISETHGEGFKPRITEHQIDTDNSILLIEPDCGSNISVLKSHGKYLCIDTGYACYKDEMLSLFETLIPNFRSLEKTAIITHPDLDHTGLLPWFDHIICTKKSAEQFVLEQMGEPGPRELNPLHRSYMDICKVLTRYRSPDISKVEMPWKKENDGSELLMKVGTYDFGDFHFAVYEGAGGHVPGEIILIDEGHHIAFSGDIYVNIKGMTPIQREYNRYAPILMSSVDMDAKKSTAERNAFLELLTMIDTGKVYDPDHSPRWKVFCGHGAVKEL